jgi:imidazolonepropionase-like amidohydrolase
MLILLTVIVSLMGNPGPTEGVVNSVDDAKQAVRQRYKMVLIGSKLLLQVVFYPLQKRTNAQFSQEEMDAIVSTAKDYGLQVAAHAHGDDGMQRN